MYATWLHNSLPVALFIAVAVVLFFLIRKPRRKYIFLLVGLVMLLLEFEYVKHFGKNLEEQTITSVLIQGGHLRTKSVLEDIFQKIIRYRAKRKS